MTQFLPPNLLALFAPREPINYLPPVAKLPHEKKSRGYQGVGGFLAEFEDPKETPLPTKVETREERLERRHRERAEQVVYKLEQEIAVWDPNTASNITTDPFRTLFVARINYDTSESKLRREFEIHGPIKKIALIHSSVNGKPKGYAFIEYEHERDMHSAYKHADGKKIDGRRVLVDVERARTVKGWLPRRLGGGLGGTRRGGPDVNIKHSGREDNERERERYRLEQRERDTPMMGRGGGGGRRSRSPRERRRERRSRSRTPPRRSDVTTKRSRRNSKETAGGGGGGGGDDYESRPPRDKDRERDKERKRRRSRSKDRDRKRERRERRDRERMESSYIKTDESGGGDVRVKEEPVDDYIYSQYPVEEYGKTHIKYENEPDEKFETANMNNGTNRRYEEYEEGEAY